jgi:hypothetical protein
MSAKSAPKRIVDSDIVTVFFTGSELGAMKPCGCSGGQLGGLDRRAAVLNTVDRSKRMVFEAGSFVPGDTEQNQIKLQILFQAYELLCYDFVNLTPADTDMVTNLAMLQDRNRTFKAITANAPADSNLPAAFTKQFSFSGKKLNVTVAAFDPNSQPIDRLTGLFNASADAPTANILILNTSAPETLDAVAKAGIIDCVICPSPSDEPLLLSKPGERPLRLASGKIGKYVASLRIKLDKNTQKPDFSFKAIPITEDLPKDKAIVDLYKTYQQIVKDANLLEKHPRFPLPKGLRYIGSEACMHCHEYEYPKWKTKAHAQAYATLEKDGTQYDPECIQCHVVGFDYQGGFISERKTPQFKDVGCENCHGPGSEHAATLGTEKTGAVFSNCTDCHTPDHSSGYAGHEDEYLKKIVHWKEPKAAGNVK